MLDLAKVPTADAKKLVRDVIMNREGELIKSRREIRALKDRIDHLEGVIMGIKHASHESARSNGSDYVSQGLNSPGFMAAFLNKDSNRTIEQTALESIDYLAPADQKKKQALSIILMELTRLRKSNADIVSEKQYLSDIVSNYFD
jgi:hypothetical protein